MSKPKSVLKEWGIFPIIIFITYLSIASIQLFLVGVWIYVEGVTIINLVILFLNLGMFSLALLPFIKQEKIVYRIFKKI